MTEPPLDEGVEQGAEPLGIPHEASERFALRVLCYPEEVLEHVLPRNTQRVAVIVDRERPDLCHSGSLSDKGLPQVAILATGVKLVITQGSRVR